jgi:hypothetical protein
MLKAMLRLLAYAAVLIIVAACDTQFSAMPNPVVVKDGVYWFPLGGRLFAVPEKYVTGYSRRSTDGLLSTFEMHALLPDFVGRTDENKAKFSVMGWGDRIDVRVHMAKAYTQDEIYFRRKQINGTKLISEYPHIEKSVDFDDHFFLFENGYVQKIISCTNGTENVHNYCRNMFLHYRDDIYIWITYSRVHEQDWIKIHDQVITFLESFERPLDAFPTHP